MTDVFSKLGRLKWRNIEVPVAARSASFQHEQVQHKFQFRDNELVEATGVHNWLFSYTIPFREDIAKGPYKNLFTVTLPKFIEACRDRSNGLLEDPVLGDFQARCVSLSDESDVNRRDGDDVKVEFIYSPDLVDINIIDGGVVDVQSVTSDAGELDKELVAQKKLFPEPPEPLLDPLSALNGFGRQLSRQGEKLSAALEDLAFRADKLDKTIDVLENPQNWPLKRASRHVRDSALRLSARATDPQKNILTVANRYAATISVVAANLNMALPEFLRLNPGLARNPLVPVGALLNFYR